MAKTSVLFVCMGNICRSPSAEGVFLKLLASQKLTPHFNVDSAGTHGYHVGEPADGRAIRYAHKRRIDIRNHRARQVEIEDFARYDYVLAMDDENMHRLLGLCPPEHQHKVKLLLTFAPECGVAHVPDPYDGGAKGFEEVLDLCEAACQGLLAEIQAQLKLP